MIFLKGDALAGGLLFIIVISIDVDILASPSNSLGLVFSFLVYVLRLQISGQ